MANLEQLINEKQAADTQWREQRQTERQAVTDTQDSEITRITTDPAAYARYLNMQADNLSYSPGNIALVMAQSPTATVFGTPERWRSMGRNVQSAELGKGIGIFARSEQGYVMADAFDISQTDGRELRKPPQLTDESKEMEGALKALLNYSLVPVVADTEMETPAFYDQSNLELAINPAYSDSEAFTAIAAEVAHSRFHKRGYNADYLRADCDLDAQSISYILCRRFGVSRDLPDLSKLSDLYRDWPPESRRAILDGIQDLSKKMGYAQMKECREELRECAANLKAAQAAALQKPEDYDRKIEAAQGRIKELKKLIADVAIYVSERAKLTFSALKMNKVEISLYDVVKSTGERKDVFKFTYGGRRYDRLSLSEKIRAGMEVSELMKRLTGRNYPVFVDNMESVDDLNNVRPTGQVIMAKCVSGAPLAVRPVRPIAAAEQRAA